MMLLHVAVVSVGSQRMCATQHLPLCVSMRLARALRDFSDSQHRPLAGPARTLRKAVFMCEVMLLLLTSPL